MADKVSKKRRSEIMSSVRSKDTEPELIVRKYLFSEGLRYRVNDKSLPGRPDIKLTKFKTIVFVNGCFWHGHKDCKIYVMPKTNKKFWNDKIERNKERDKKNLRKLKKLGWNVIVIWECDIKRKSSRNKVLKKVLKKILKTDNQFKAN